jgi:NTE family protein
MADPYLDLEQGTDEMLRRYDHHGMALSLSGGGYKAAAYHLGALIRLNELGILARLKRITSVSGGSIAAGLLGLKWKELVWSGEVAANFDDAVVEPLVRFLTTANIDLFAGVLGLVLPGRSGGDQLEAAYAKGLFGAATLQDLPDDTDAPRFVILATNYQLNSLWRFARPYAADYRVGMIHRPTFGLARVVAASSGFPPFFCPISLDFAGQDLRPMAGADMHRPPFTERCLLADGGIYDNMGLEPIWKRYGVLLVSNAGDRFDETTHPPTNWFSLLRRALSMVHRQAENNRVRWLMEMDQEGKRQVAYWPLRDSVALFSVEGAVAPSPEDIHAAVCQPVRLWALSSNGLRQLVQHGYSLCDAAVRARLQLADPAPPRLPGIGRGDVRAG